MEPDTKYTNNAICPYCGYENKDSWELFKNSGTATCCNCDRAYRYSRDVITTYCTSKIECSNLSDIRGFKEVTKEEREKERISIYKYLI